MPSFRYISYVLMLTLGSTVHAGSAAQPTQPQQATLDDGQQRSGLLQRSVEGRFVFQSGDASIPARRLLHIDFPSSAQPKLSAAPFRVWLWGGEHLAAQRISLADDTVQLVLSDETKVQLKRSALAAVGAAADRNEVPTGRRSLGIDQDQILLSTGDELFGKLLALDDEAVSLQGAFPSIRIAWEEVRQVQLHRRGVAGRAVGGLLVRLYLRNTDEPARDDVLRGALREIGDDSLVLDHAHLGRLNLPRSRVRALDVLGEGLRVEIDAAERHLGNDVRTELPLPFPDGTELVRTFALEDVPDGAAEIVCDVLQLESARPGGRFAKELQEGHLRSGVWINEKPVDYLNRHVTRPIDLPQLLRVPIPPGTLQPGTNTLRISQTPLPYDKSDYDDFLLSNLAVEFPVSP